MIKNFLLTIILLNITLLQAQVGINTQSPQGIFHIDAQGDTNKDLNVSDDILVFKIGNVGIGTTTPETKLDIISSTPGAIRIVDTNEGNSKILTSTTTGEATWVSVIGVWNASLTGGNLPYGTTSGYRKINFTGGSISRPETGNINIANSSITVPYTGSYRITLFGTSLKNPETPTLDGYFIAGFYNIRSNEKEIWAPHSLGAISISNSPYVSYYTLISLKQNDVLTIYNTETSGHFANGVSNLTFFVEYVQ